MVLPELKTDLLRRPFLALLLGILTVSGAFGRAGEVTDMMGRTVTIGRVGKVWPAYPPIAYMVYAIDPTLLVGWSNKLTPENKKYIRRPQQNLPVIGGWFGQRTPNMENLALIKPDIALVWDQTLTIAPSMLDRLQRMGIPVLAVRLFQLADYPEAFRFVGHVLNRKRRGDELASYIDRTLIDMKTFSQAIPEAKKVSVYYALGPDGLTNDCNHLPFLNEAINLAGGRNAHHCPQDGRTIGNKIDAERLLLYNPDVILTQDDVFFARVFTDPRFKLLKAVRNRRVYRVPNTPFNWLCFPPNFMKAIGVRWLAHTLYPERYPAKDLRKETKRFFKLFLGVDISENEANTLLLLK